MRRLLRSAVAALAVLSLAACAFVDLGTEGGGGGRLTVEQVAFLVVDSLDEHGNVLMAVEATPTGGYPVEADLAVSRRGDASDIEVTIGDDGPEQLRMFLTGDLFLVRFAGLQLQPGQEWAEIDPSSDESAVQMLSTRAEVFRDVADPTQDALTGATGTLISTVERGDVTIYTVHVDLGRAMREVDVVEYLTALGDPAGQLAALAPELAASGVELQDLTDADVEQVRAALLRQYEGETNTVKVAVGSDGLPRSVRTERKGDGPYGYVLSTAYSGWGTTTVQVPSAAEIAPKSHLGGDG